MSKKLLGPLVLILTIALVASACSGGGSDNAGNSESCPSDVEGEVVVSGSSTVEPISALVGESLLDCGSGVGAVVDGPGTGDGMALFCAGETDISDASRPIKDAEAADCADAGVEFIELKVAFDGISVLTNPSNDAIDCLSFADLYALVGPESDGVNRWSDAQALATELGSTTELPDASIRITAPGAESGTYDSFIELALKSIAEERAASGQLTENEVATLRNDYASQADDTAIVSAIEAESTPLGWVGFAYAEEAGDQVKELGISGDGGQCIAPSVEAVADGSYPLSRGLYIYVNKAKAEANPAVAAYVDFYLSPDGLASVGEAGYVDLPADQVAVSVATWEARTTGSTAG